MHRHLPEDRNIWDWYQDSERLVEPEGNLVLVLKYYLLIRRGQKWHYIGPQSNQRQGRHLFRWKD